jgi:surface antigen
VRLGLTQTLGRKPTIDWLTALLIVAVVGGSVFEPAYADPPPWAPAYGYRAKHKNKVAHAPSAAPFDIEFGRCNRDLLGGVLGGAAGAAVGSTIGKGSGNTAAIVGGAIIGIIVGGSIGRAMDEVDQNCVGQTLEHAPDGETIVWTNAETRTDYRVTPTRTYDSNGRSCREYVSTAIVGGRAQQVYDRACRQPDGSWQLVS